MALHIRSCFLNLFVVKFLMHYIANLVIWESIKRIQERAYWPRYMEDIQRWTRSCEECQKSNSPPTAPAPLVPIVASSPFEKVAWDIMGPLPETKRGNKYILVLTDLFTKWVEAFPLKETSAETLAGVLYNEFICRFGLPKYIHSYQGRNLCGKVMQSLCGLLGIQRTNTTAYHPQGNGQTERFNRTLESMIAKMTQENSQDWDLQIPHALMPIERLSMNLPIFHLFS